MANLSKPVTCTQFVFGNLKDTMGIILFHLVNNIELKLLDATYSRQSSEYRWGQFIKYFYVKKVTILNYHISDKYNPKDSFYVMF